MKKDIVTNQTELETQKIAVIIPCLNEERTISKVIRDFRNALPQAEIYVYDNHSADWTVDYALAAGARIRYEGRQGKGNVIRSAFREIDADCYILVDGDDTYPAEQAEKMAALVLEDHADMVIGDRLSGSYFTENSRRFHNTGNRLVCFLINRMFHSHIHDVMTGYRALSRNFVKTLPVLSKRFEIETEMTIHALDKNMDIREIPISYRNRPFGSVSKLHTYIDGFKVIKTIFQLYRQYKPFVYFGILAVMLFFISLFLLLSVYSEYLITGLIANFPTLIAAGALFLTAIFSLFSGFILETINRHNRQMFELFLIQNQSESM